MATLATCLVSSGAFAADLPVRTPPTAPSPYSPAPAHSWTGLYAGIAVGWTQFSEETRPSNSTSRDEGFVGGAFAGYNWQFGPLVAGVEADVEATGGVKLGFATPVWGQVSGGYWSKVGVQASVRARFGYAFENIMYFVTGGLAVADVDTRYFYDNLIENFGETQTGWTLGFGVEWGFYQNWIARMEYRYTDLGTYRANPVSTWGGQFIDPRTSHDLTSQTFRLGLGYKFTGTPLTQPALARY
ncbi:MAG: outer membrane protein [Beijerinckiaceae bacterium]